MQPLVASEQRTRGVDQILCIHLELPLIFFRILAEPARFNLSDPRQFSSAFNNAHKTRDEDVPHGLQDNRLDSPSGDRIGSRQP